MVVKYPGDRHGIFYGHIPWDDDLMNGIMFKHVGFVKQGNEILDERGGNIVPDMGEELP